MKPQVLVAGRLMAHVMAEIEEKYTAYKLYEAADRAAFLREIGPQVRAIATSTFYGAPPDLIDACPNVELIASFGVGTDSLAVEHARRRGVKVTNTPDVLNDDVA